MYSVEVADIVNNVWQSLLEFDITLIDEPEPVSRSQWALTGCIQITGAWRGAITATCGESLGRQIAGAMMGLSPEDVTREDLSDSIGEIINMVGGNVKALLPSPCQLSLPSVTSGGQFELTVSRAEVVDTLHFQSLGFPIVLQVLHERSATEG